jgi:nicotinic acid mononucleotide adenylyltransferase
MEALVQVGQIFHKGERWQVKEEILELAAWVCIKRSKSRMLLYKRKTVLHLVQTVNTEIQVYTIRTFSFNYKKIICFMSESCN